MPTYKDVQTRLDNEGHPFTDSSARNLVNSVKKGQISAEDAMLDITRAQEQAQGIRREPSFDIARGGANRQDFLKVAGRERNPVPGSTAEEALVQTGFIEAESDVEEPQLTQEVMANYPVHAPEQGATLFAHAISQATDALSFEQVREQYYRNGFDAEWEALKTIWLKAKDQEFAAYTASQIVAFAQTMDMSTQEAYGVDSARFDALIDNQARSFQQLSETPELAAQMENQATRAALDFEWDDTGDFVDNVMGDLDKRITREQMVAEENYAAAMQFFKDMYGDDWEPDTFKEWAEGIAFEAGVGFLSYQWFWAAMAEAVNVELSTGEKFLAGSVQKKIREAYAARSPEEKQAFMEDFKNFMVANPHLAFHSFRGFDVMNSLFNPEVIQQLDTENQLDLVLNNLFPIIDFLGLAAGTLKLLKPLRASNAAPIKATNAVNKARTQQDLAAILAEADAQGAASRWAITKEEIVQTQMPKPPGSQTLEDVPGGIAEEAERVRALQETAKGIVGDTTNAAIPTADKLAAVERTAAALERVTGAKIRSGASELVFSADENSVTIRAMMGKDDLTGFMTDKEAYEFVEEMADPNALEKVSLWVSDGTEMRPFVSGDEALERLEQINSGVLPRTNGNFYVRMDSDYVFDALDRQAFGENPVLGPLWGGGAWRPYLLTPSARFSPEVYRPYLQNFYKAQALQETLNAITAPIFKMSSKKQRQLDQILDWQSEFGRTEGRLPSYEEIEDVFRGTMEMDDEMKRGIFLTREFYDTIYNVQNTRLRQNWAAQGYRTATIRGQSVEYHGKPQTRQELSSSLGDDGNYTVYDAATNQTRSFTPQEMTKYLDEGNSVLKSDLAVEVGPAEFHHLIAVDKGNSAVKLGDLSEFPLKNIPGYYPRMYEDFVFIEKVVDGAVDGSATRHVYTTHVARTPKQAEKMVERLRAADPDAEWRVKDTDVRLSDKDRVMLDVERMQVQGRLFFDERSQERLRAVDGGMADIVSPLTAIERTSRAVSRQVGTEQLVRSYKVAFMRQYGDLGIRDILDKPSVIVRDNIDEQLKAAQGMRRRHLAAARDLWQHIRLMEGTVNSGKNYARRAAMSTANFVDDLIPGGSKATQWAVRNAHKFAPLDQIKAYVFWDYLVTRPMRQLILQGAQHLFVQSIDPAYAGRLQLHAKSLMSAARNRAVRRSGVKGRNSTFALADSTHAKMLGLNEQEMAVLLEEFDRAGLTQMISMHSMAGGRIPSPRAPSTSMVQSTGRAVKDAVTRFPARIGFEAGERFNLAASYMLAVRQYRKANKIDDLRTISAQGWREIQAMGADFALAMARPNQAAFQNGLLSIPLQFLQFTHKTALIGLRAFGKNVGNQQITTKQARMIVAGQLFMFGGAGLGIKDHVQTAMEASGLGHLANTPVADMLEGGLVDTLLDESLNFAFDKFEGDPDEIDLPWDEFLAPGANIWNTTAEIIEGLTVESHPLETMFGASFNSFSRWGQAYETIGVILGMENDTALSKWSRVVDQILQGAASGYSDVQKAMLMARWNKDRSAQSGQLRDLDASWADILARGLLGVTSQAQLDQFTFWEDTVKAEAEIKEFGKSYAQAVTRIIGNYNDDMFDYDKFLTEARGARAMLDVLDPYERGLALEAFRDEMRRLETPSSSWAMQLATKFAHGNAPKERTLWLIRTSPSLNPEERAALMQLVELWYQERDQYAEDVVSTADQDVEIIRGARDGR